MSIKVQFEIGHTAALKTKKGTDNFTHDWELYVKGVDKADISSYIEKIVFNLHESFPKPKRTFKEPPYVLKESGYAGFILPIDIYFKNRSIQTYQYDIDLQPSGPPVHKCEIKKHIFENPTEDFRQKLLKGGGLLQGNADEDRNRGTDNDFQHKTKSTSSGNNVVGHDSLLKKSHKMRPEKSKIQNFENIFGKPITKTSTSASLVNPGANVNSTKSTLQEQKSKQHPSNNIQIASISSKISNLNKTEKTISNSSQSNIKEKSEISEKSEKKEKHKHSSHKDKDKDKSSKERKDDKHERREERDRKKDKSHSKERDRSTEKSKIRIESPQRKKQRTSSPLVNNISRKSPSRSSSATSKEEGKLKSSTPVVQNSLQNSSQAHQQNSSLQQPNESDKKSSTSSSKKSKKDKKSHEKDRESRKDKEIKTHTLDQASRSSNTVSYSGNSNTTVASNNNNIEANKMHKQDPSSIKTLPKSKIEQKIISEAPIALTASNAGSSTSVSKKSSEKYENEEKRHKHKKKDRSKDKDKEKNRDRDSLSSKDKEKKKEKKSVKDDLKKNKEEDVGSNAASSSNLGPTESLHESLFNSDHDSHHSEADKINHHSESANQIIVTNTIKNKPSAQNIPKLSTNIMPNPILSNETTAENTEKKDKKPKEPKTEREEKKRKRKSREVAIESNLSSSVANIINTESQSKISKKNSVDLKNSEKQLPLLQHNHIQHQSGAVQPTDSFRAPSMSSVSSISASSAVPNIQPNSRINVNNANPANSNFDLEYISELKELQEKIMTLQDNTELQKVVEIIAATGRFEITSKTFDFDLCALDRNTIQRLHVIV